MHRPSMFPLRMLKCQHWEGVSKKPLLKQLQEGEEHAAQRSFYRRRSYPVFGRRVRISSEQTFARNRWFGRNLIRSSLSHTELPYLTGNFVLRWIRNRIPCHHDLRSRCSLRTRALRATRGWTEIARTSTPARFAIAAAAEQSLVWRPPCVGW